MPSLTSPASFSGLTRRQWLAGAGAFAALSGTGRAQQPQYDLLLRGGRLIDAKNGINAVRDVAALDGKVAEVAAKIDPARAFKVVDVDGLYVTPGLIDIHAHVFAGTNERGSYAGDNSLYPDGYTLRVGVTTVADCGCAGWRNFDVFKDTVIDRSRTRVLAFLNIVGHGMRGGDFEQNLADMKAEPAIEMAKKHKGLIIGIKTAHYAGPEWEPVENAVKAGTAADIPVMVDFGSNRKERPLAELLRNKLRPGDIYTHCYSGLRGEVDESGKVNPGMFDGRKRGVIFDVGHGGGSFVWRIAAPCIKQGLPPDSISTDLHTGSMNSGMMSQINVMSKMMALGLSVEDVVKQSTWNPAREIQREDLGHLSVGAIADIAVLREEKGDFGFTDIYGARLKGNRKLDCEMTFLAGKLAYDLNGRTREDWDKLPAGYDRQGDRRWDGILHRGRR
jgi:dihydroorotase